MGVVSSLFTMETMVEETVPNLKETAPGPILFELLYTAADLSQQEVTFLPENEDAHVNKCSPETISETNSNKQQVD